jgi:4-amino-4-deoxy-L-arabinose transferase-like glycosyltransferase
VPGPAPTASDETLSGDPRVRAAAARGHVARALRVVVALQLITLLALAAVTTGKFRVWADIDERPHYDYVQKLVEEHRIPRPTDLVSPEVQAITDRTWPRPSPTDPATLGRNGQSFEAMQPPLTYLAAAPAFAAVPDHRDKVFALRVWDALLLAVSVLLLWRFSRRLAEPGPALVGFSAALSVLLLPGVVVRSVTFGNTPLELLLSTAYLLVLWRADQTGRARALAAAAVLLGLCLLTKLTLLPFVPLLLLVLWRTARSGPARRRWALLAVPPLMLAPWLVLNIARYGSPTVNIAGEAGAAGPVQTTGLGDRIGALPGLLERLPDGVVPQEWVRRVLDVTWIDVLTDVLALGLLAAGLAALARGRRDWRAWFLALPLLGAVALIVAVYLVTGTDSFYLRYVYAALLPFALGAGIGLTRGAASWRHVGALLAANVVAGVLWTYLAGYFWFNGLGRTLGII